MLHTVAKTREQPDCPDGNGQGRRAARTGHTRPSRRVNCSLQQRGGPERADAKQVRKTAITNVTSRTTQVTSETGHELTHKTETDSRDTEQTCGCGRRGGKDGSPGSAAANYPIQGGKRGPPVQQGNHVQIP